MSSTSNYLVRASAVSKLPVVTIDAGEDAAEVKDVVYDAVQHHLLGFTLNKRGWFRGALKAVLAADDIVAIGADAVMIATADDLSDTGHAPSNVSSSGQNFDVMGDTVMTADGTALGTVIDVIIETGRHPQAVGYEVSTESGSVFVPTTAQMGLSGENLVVPPEATEFINNDLAGFGASVRTFRERLDHSESDSRNAGTDS